MADRIKNDALKKFREAAWDRLTLQLTKYAVYKVRRLEWKTGSFLPKGMLPEDLSLEAIRKTCEGLISEKPGKGIRIWDPEKNPDLLEYLKSVIDSDVYALVESAEHRYTNYSAHLPQDQAANLTVQMIDSSGLGISMLATNAEETMIMHEAKVTEEQKLSTLLADLHVLCADDEEELLILTAYQEAAKRNEKVKPSLVARYAGLDEKTARNAMRRLTRKVERRRFDE